MKKILLASLSLALATVGAHAQLLNIQSARDGTYDMTGKAVLGVSNSDAWATAPNDDVYLYDSSTNSYVKQTYATLSNPTYADGSTATGVTVTFNNIDSLYSGDSAPYAGASNVFGSYLRFNPYLHTEGGGNEPNASIVFSGLSSATTYSLVIYGNDEATNGFGRSFEAIVNGKSEFLSLQSTAGYASSPDGTTDGVATYDGNYLKFTGLSAAGGNLTIDLLGLTNGGEVDITGLQLEAAPEPSSVWMGVLGLGVLGWLGRRQMRRLV